MKTPERPFLRIPEDPDDQDRLIRKLREAKERRVLPVARVVDNSLGAKKAELSRKLAEALARMPLPVRLAYRAWRRLNRRKWERERQERLDAQREFFCVAMASIRRDVEGLIGR